MRNIPQDYNPFETGLPGEPYVYNVPDPSAGANFILTLDQNFTHHVPLCVYFLLTTSAVVGNRVPVIELQENGRVIAVALRATNITAGLAINCCFFHGAASEGLFSTNAQGSMPRLVMKDRAIVRSNVAGLLAGDTITRVAVSTLRWRQKVDKQY